MKFVSAMLRSAMTLTKDRSVKSALSRPIMAALRSLQEICGKDYYGWQCVGLAIVSILWYVSQRAIFGAGRGRDDSYHCDVLSS